MANRVSVLSGGTRALLLGGLVLPFFCALVSCESLQQIAPLPETFAPNGSNTPQLQRGRELYITACATCHAPEPVVDYSEAEWVGKILPEMCRLTKLNGHDSEAVHAYVLAVLRSTKESNAGQVR